MSFSLPDSLPQPFFFQLCFSLDGTTVFIINHTQILGGTFDFFPILPIITATTVGSELNYLC